MICSKTGMLSLAILLANPSPAMAYIGPGGGLSAIGVFLALVAGVILALLGFVWYPIKRLINRLKRQTPLEKDRDME